MIPIQGEHLSVIKDPNSEQGSFMVSAHTRSVEDVLPPRYSLERLYALRLLYYDTYNNVFRNGVMRIVHQIQGKTWLVEGPDPIIAEYFTRVIRSANFGDLDSFLSTFIIHYLTLDTGPVVELVAPGNPLDEPTGAVISLNTLDPLQCLYRRGYKYPIVYINEEGNYYKLHYSRVRRYPDLPDVQDHYSLWGDCALSRALPVVIRQQLLQQYVQAAIDDRPAPGIRIFKGLTEAQVNAAFVRMENDRQDWGKALNLYSLSPETPIDVTTIRLSELPPEYDVTGALETDVRLIAQTLGLDLQDLWTLDGNFGTATQSEILNAKSYASGVGHIMAKLSKLFNSILPEGYTFFWEKDLNDAINTQRQVTVIQQAAMAVSMIDVLSIPERRDLLARLVPDIAEVLQDDLSDPVPAQVDVDDINDPSPIPLDDSTLSGTRSNRIEKRSLGLIASLFTRQFNILVSRFIDQSASTETIQRAFTQLVRQFVTESYEQGLFDSGVRNRRVVEAAKAADINRYVRAQRPYIDRAAAALAGEVAQLPTANGWFNKSIRSAYFAGVLRGDKLRPSTLPELLLGRRNRHYIWRIGPTEQSCADCLALNGQVHTLDEYISSGMYPGSSALACHGDNCECRIEKTNRALTGTLPVSAPSDNQAAFLQGLLS